jgi:hypothetical protein
MKKRVEEQFEADMENVCKSKSNKAQKLFCNKTADWYTFCVKHWPANKASDPEPPLM